MERTQIENVVRVYKNYSGVNIRITDPLIEHINKLGERFTEVEMLEVVGSIKASSIYNILNLEFMTQHLKAASQLKEMQDKIAEAEKRLEEKNKFDIEQEQSTASLGLVEKALARVMMDEYAPMLAEGVVTAAKQKIEEVYGKLEKKIEYQLPATGGKLDEVTHEQFETVLAFVMANEPVMLIGPAGTGKNVICKQVAKIMNLDFYFSNAVTQEYKLTGFIDAYGVYQETEFYKAFKNGGVFMLDEIDASIPEVLVILNAAIANRYFDFPNGKIEAHENFRVVAAGNTYGTGASYQYVGRNQLDAASLDRFAQVEIDYSPRIEESLTEDKRLISFIRKFRKACGDRGINHIVSYRTITRLCKMKSVMPIETALKTCLIKNMEKDDLNMIISDFRNNESEWEEGLRKCAE